MITDPIADYLTRIRNAVKANHRVVDSGNDAKNGCPSKSERRVSFNIPIKFALQE